MTPEVRKAIAELNAALASALDHEEFERLRNVFQADVHYAAPDGEFTDLDSLITSFHAKAGSRSIRYVPGSMLLEARNDHTVIAVSTWHTFTGEAGTGACLIADFLDLYLEQPDGDWLIAERVVQPAGQDPPPSVRGL